MSNYLGVGIHENVVLGNNTAINDKGSLVVELETKAQSGSMLDAFNEGENVEQSSASIILWPINMTTWDGKTKTATQIGQDINNLKNTLVDILMVYMTSDKAKTALNAEVMFKGLGISQETQGTLPTRLLQESFVKSVYTNICTAFIESAKPFMSDVTFRIKLRRTSKAKHFATIPAKGKFPETWIEPMTVPAEASKISWSTYELKNGLNDGTPQETDTVSASAQEEVAQMFTPPPQGDAGVEIPSTPPVAPEQASNPFNQ